MPLTLVNKCQVPKLSGVVRELPRVGVTEDGEVQVVRDDSGDVHVYAKSTDDILIHRKKTDSSKVTSFDFLSIECCVTVEVILFCLELSDNMIMIYAH